MKKSRLLGTLCACVIGILVSNAVWSSPIMITINDIKSAAYDSSTDSDTSTSRVIPTTDTLMATDGNSSSTTNILYTGDANNATLHHDFSHAIDNTAGDDTTSSDYAETFLAMIFTANTSTTYSINGLYGMTGPSGTRTFFDVSLRDITTATMLFRDHSLSYNTAYESFILGVAGDGDYYSNLNEGSLTGNLIAEHEYQYYLYAYIQAYDGSAASQVAATAAGQVNLNIGTVPPPCRLAIRLWSSWPNRNG